MRSIDKIKCKALNVKCVTGLLSLMIIAGTIGAQTVSQERESHHKIKSFITTKYPDAKSISILDEYWGYRTRFKTQDGKCVSSFSIKNDWLQTESKVKVADIPDSVKQGFKNSKYDKVKVLAAKKLMLPSEPSVLYVIEVRTTIPNNDLNDNYGLADTKDRKIYFTAGGQLAIEQEEPGEAIKSIPWGGQ
jgi:hypothetical protein